MAAVVVVGGGLAGLAAAARLARQRHDVTLLDDQATGGPERPAAEPGSFTLPAVYRDLFRKTGRPLDAHVQLVPVDPARRYVFPDGRVLDLPTGSRGAMLEAFGHTLGPSAAKEWDAVIARGGAVWSAVRPSVVPPGEAAQPEDPAPARVRLRDPANRLLLAWYAVDAGADPSRPPPELTVLPYLEQAFGAWQVEGGLAALATAVADRARRCGATLRGDAEVVDLVGGRDVRGVRLADGSTVVADLVVDTVGRLTGDVAPGAGPARGPAVLTVRAQTSEPLDLPVETVLLPRAGGRGVSIVRPDVVGEPTVVLLRASVPAFSPADEEDAVHRLLDAANRAGARVTAADVVSVTVQATAAPRRRSRWPRRPTGWLDLRAPLAVPGVAGLLRAVPGVGGAIAVPWQGLAAALAAHAGGTVPRQRGTTPPRGPADNDDRR